MQRKKNNRSKSPDPAVERKSTLRKKIKQKQDESLKSNIVTSSDDQSEESSSSSSEKTLLSDQEEIVVSKKSKSQKEKQEKKEKAEAKEKPKPKPIKKTGKPDPLVAGYEEEVVLGSADDCLICADGGQILCCDNCHRAFHMKCIKLREKPTGDWFCPYCEDLQENLDICANCQESVSDMEHYELLTCSKCLRNMHYGCSDVPLSLIVDNPFNKNFIFEPEVVKELKQNLLKHSMEPEDLIKELYNKHAFEYLFHICNECVSTFGIQKIKNNCKQQLGDSVKDFYLAKLKRASDIHCAWLPEAKVEESSKLLLRHFKRNYGVDDEAQEINTGMSDSDEENPLGQDESYRVERVLACKRPVSASKKNVNQIQQEIQALTPKAKPGLNNYKFLIKWEDMEYHYVTWEDEFIILKFKEKATKYFESRKLKKKSSKKAEINESNTKLVRFNTQPNCFEGKLFEYQLIGVNWLINQYIQRNNAILADEMGLGKTIQTLCLLKYLSSQFGLEGPFLIVAPTSTVFNWQREAAKWCPDFDVIIYGGDGVSRRKIMESEFVQGERGSELEPRFNMAITTYTFINQDIARLKKIKWEVVVVDEAQRLKNRESKLYGMCADLETNFKLLLTGTPIQNTIDELISLVRYIIPNKPKLLNDIDDLTSALVTKNPANPIVKKDAGDDGEREEALKKLKGILKNHMLRRTVADANLKFPELEEKIVRLNLTNMQKHLYKNILLKNYSVLSSAEAFIGKQKGGKRGGENLRISLINVLTHLRLVCNHPDLFYSRSFNYDTNEESFRDLVLNASNKLKFLDKVIPRLLDAGHKILMFTQFVLMLDIIEEFLIFKNYEYDRLDGTTRNSDRQKIIDSFNNGRSKIFILSTRAGGLGINLTSSDTVIFVDSDFNPYRDIQAFCRAYRIGQKNKVMVYRLVSKFTVEEKIVENATKKLMLGEMIINPIDQSKSDKSVVESILRHGAMELFDKTFDQENDDEITEEKLDELLSREAKPIPTTAQKPKMNDLNDFYLSGFNFIDFSFAPIIAKDNQTKSSKEDKYWETLLAQDAADYEKDNVEALGKGKRTKRTLQNQPTNVPLPTSSPESSSDSASEASEPKRRGAGGDKSDHSSEDEEEDVKAPQQVVLPENLMNYYNQLGSLFEETKEKGLEEIIKSYGLPDLTRLKFLEFVMKFGISPFRAEDVYKNFCLFIEPISGIVKLPDSLTFRHYLKQFYCCLLYENEPTPLTEFFFFKATPQIVRRRVVGFLNLKNKVNYYRAKPEKFKVRSKRYKRLFEEDGKGMETEDDGDNEDKWDNIDDYYLFDGISRYGMEEWDRIMKDSELWDRSEPKAYEDGDVWKLIFKKIEDKEPPENKELECVQYIKDYLRMRSNLLMNMLLEEKEKKSTKDDV